MNMLGKVKVFLLESPNALDLVEERGERHSLEQICKLFGHGVASFLLRDSVELKQTLMYVSSIVQADESGRAPLFVHISAHGNADGIAIGSDHVSWRDLATMLSRAYENLDRYDSPVSLILSACGANEQKLTKLIASKYGKDKICFPPEYVFVFSDEEVDWRDAVVVWTMFYREAPRLDFLSDRKKHVMEVQTFLKRLGDSNFGTLTYFRWDKDRYMKYTGQ